MCDAPALQEFFCVVGGVLWPTVAAEHAWHTGGREHTAEVTNQSLGSGVSGTVNDRGPAGQAIGVYEVRAAGVLEEIRGYGLKYPFWWRVGEHGLPLLTG